MWIVAVVIVAIWIAGSMKSSRTDGVLLDRVHPYRRLMPYVMQGRNESVVFFDDYVRADAFLAYLEEAGKRFTVDVSHCLVASIMVSLGINPSMNRFVSGRRLYQRHGIHVTFSMKRKQLDRAAKLAVVKIGSREGETFRELCERIEAELGVERSGAKTYADKEFDLFGMLPRPLMRAGVGIVRLLDYYNVLPASFIEHDGMYTSAFIANLGSLGMRPGFHHLYEWGNCPLFMMVGRIEEKPVVEEGKVVSHRFLHIRWSYDERIDDGLNARFGLDRVRIALENPHEYFGCLRDDGSDARPLTAVAAEIDARATGQAAA
jgi:hypothetical protein